MKVISFIPLIYSRSGAFWDRDLGLVTLGLQELGVDGLFAALQGDSPEQGRPLLTPTTSQARDSSWWRDQQPDAVILNAWGIPRHDGVRKAVCSLGCPVIEKLDTDGVKSPRIYPTHSLRRSLVDYDRTNYLSTGLRAQIYGLAKFFISLALPSTGASLFQDLFCLPCPCCCYNPASCTNRLHDMASGRSEKKPSSCCGTMA